MTFEKLFSVVYSHICIIRFPLWLNVRPHWLHLYSGHWWGIRILLTRNLKIFLGGKIRYKSYMIINQSQNSNSKFFTFSWPLRGSGGGGLTQAVSLTAFSQFFFTPSLRNSQNKFNSKRWSSIIGTGGKYLRRRRGNIFWKDSSEWSGHLTLLNIALWYAFQEWLPKCIGNREKVVSVCWIAYLQNLR